MIGNPMNSYGICRAGLFPPTVYIYIYIFIQVETTACSPTTPSATEKQQAGQGKQLFSVLHPSTP